jgi:hypothetical protein
MFPFNSIQSNSQRSDSTRRRLWRSTLVPLALFCLVTALLFSGCQMEEDNSVDDHKLNEKLIGTWADKSWGGGTVWDEYIITATKLTYDNGFGGGYGGTIKYVTNITNSAGVIIIQYDADKKPSYIYSTTGDTGPKGDFVGIYYEGFTPSVSVKMAQAIDLNTYSGVEKTTLEAAIAAFTSGRKGEYIDVMGTYAKQP